MVVSDSLWRRHFVGRTPAEATLIMGGMTWTVVGVLPASFGFSFLGITADAWTWMPTTTEPTSRSVSVIARLHKEATWKAASAELDALAKAHVSSNQWTWRAIPVREDLEQRLTGASAFLLGPALIVLLIGCVNVACMLLGRGIERDVELSVRTALGASRARILRQLMTEHLVLAGVAGLLGCGLAVGILRVISARLAAFPAAPDLVPDASILAVACGVSLISALLFGTLPAVRVSKRDVATALKGGTAPPSARLVGYHTRDLVVFVELALAVVLVLVAAMWLNLFAELQRIAPTFPADEVVVAHSDIEHAIPAVEAISAIPGVTGVTAVSGLPGGRSGAVQVRAKNGRLVRAARVAAQPAFFTTVGLPIVRGRTFDPGEANAHSGTVIVSETLAHAL
jgi:putative ABC transport system permease protein